MSNQLKDIATNSSVSKHEFDLFRNKLTISLVKANRYGL